MVKKDAEIKEEKEGVNEQLDLAHQETIKKKILESFLLYQKENMTSYEAFDKKRVGHSFEQFMKKIKRSNVLDQFKQILGKKSNELLTEDDFEKIALPSGRNMSFKIRELYDQTLDAKEKTACVIAQTKAIENVLGSDRLKSFRANGHFPKNFPLYMGMDSVEHLDTYFMEKGSYASYISILFDSLSTYIQNVDTLSSEKKQELLMRLETGSTFSVSSVLRVIEGLSTGVLSDSTEKTILEGSSTRSGLKKDLKMTQNLVFLSLHGLADEILPEIEHAEQAQDEYFEKKEITDISKQYSYDKFRETHPEVSHEDALPLYVKRVENQQKEDGVDTSTSLHELLDKHGQWLKNKENTQLESELVEELIDFHIISHQSITEKSGYLSSLEELGVVGTWKEFRKDFFNPSVDRIAFPGGAGEENEIVFSEKKVKLRDEPIEQVSDLSTLWSFSYSIDPQESRLPLRLRRKLFGAGPEVNNAESLSEDAETQYLMNGSTYKIMNKEGKRLYVNNEGGISQTENSDEASELELFVPGYTEDSVAYYFRVGQEDRHDVRISQSDLDRFSFSLIGAANTLPIYETSDDMLSIEQELIPAFIREKEIAPSALGVDWREEKNISLQKELLYQEIMYGDQSSEIWRELYNEQFPGNATLEDAYNQEEMPIFLNESESHEVVAQHTKNEKREKKEYYTKFVDTDTLEGRKQLPKELLDLIQESGIDIGDEGLAFWTMNGVIVANIAWYKQYLVPGTMYPLKHFFKLSLEGDDIRFSLPGDEQTQSLSYADMARYLHKNPGFTDHLHALNAWRDHFRARKNHEMMHRYLMTQKSLATNDPIPEVTSSRLAIVDHSDRILEIQLPGGKTIFLGEETICEIAEGVNGEREVREDLRDFMGERALLKQDSTGVTLINQEGEKVKLVYEQINSAFTAKNSANNRSIPEDFDIRKISQIETKLLLNTEQGVEYKMAANVRSSRVPMSGWTRDEVMNNPNQLYVVWGPSGQSGVNNKYQGLPNVISFPVQTANGVAIDNDEFQRGGYRNEIQQGINQVRQAVSEGRIVNVPGNDLGLDFRSGTTTGDLSETSAVRAEIQRGFTPYLRAQAEQDRSTQPGPSNNPQGNNAIIANASGEQNESNETNWNFNEGLNEVLQGDTTQLLDENPAIMIKLQDSKLQGGGSLWAQAVIGRVSDGSDRFYVHFEDSTEIELPSRPFRIFPMTQEGLTQFKETYGSQTYKLNNNISNLGDFSSYIQGGFDNTAKIFEGGVDGWGGLSVSGGKLQKEYVDNDVKTQTGDVEYVGSLRKSEGGDNVLFKIEPTSDGFKVSSEATDTEGQYDFERVMDYPTFMMFVADKKLKPYTKAEIDRESADNPDRGSQGWKVDGGTNVRWLSFASIISAVKKFPEAIKAKFEKKTESDATWFYSTLLKVVPDGTKFMGLGDMKREAERKREDEIWKEIESAKNDIALSEGSGGVHTSLAAKHIETEVFLNPPKTIADKRKAAGYLMYVLSKGNPYIRNLGKKGYADNAMWVRILLGEKLQKEFLEYRNKFYASLLTNGASDTDYDRLVKLELEFISAHTVEHPTYGGTFGRKLDDEKNKYSQASAVDEIKNGELQKGNILTVYNDTFMGGGLGGMNPKVTMGALEAMEEMVEDDIGYSLFYKAMIQLLISGMNAYAFDNSMKGRLKAIARRRGMPIGLFASDIRHPDKVVRIIDYITTNADPDRETLSKHLQDEAKWSFGTSKPNARTGGGKRVKIAKEVGNRWGNGVNGETVINAFNFQNDYLIRGMGGGNDVVDEYFGDSVSFNSYKDYKDSSLGDGESPFFDGVLNLAPGSFQSNLVNVNSSSGQLQHPQAREMRGKFETAIENFSSLIDRATVGARDNASHERQRDEYIEFLFKKFTFYFRDRLGERDYQELEEELEAGNFTRARLIVRIRILNDRIDKNRPLDDLFETTTDHEGVKEPIMRNTLRKLTRVLARNIPLSRTDASDEENYYRMVA